MADKPFRVDPPAPSAVNKRVRGVGVAYLDTPLAETMTDEEFRDSKGSSKTTAEIAWPEAKPLEQSAKPFKLK